MGAARFGRLAGATLGALAFGATAALAAVKVPDCPTLAKFGADPEIKQAVSINKTQGRMTLPALFLGPKMAQVFGQPALAWTQEDVAAVAKRVSECAADAKKTRNTADAAGLSVLWQGLGGLRSTLGGIAANEQRMDQWLKAVLDPPPSRPLLVVLVTVTSVKEGTVESLQRADKELRDHSVQIGGWHPFHGHAQNLMSTMREAPAASWDRVFPPIEARIAELRKWAVADAVTAINAAPETPEGLKALPPAVTKIKAEFRRSLPEAELANLDKAADARRNAIEKAMASKETARVDAAPANVEGLNLLRAVQAGPVRAVLTPARGAALDAKIAARRETIGATVTEEQIKRLDQFPGTMAGLRELDQFKSGTANGLNTLVGPQAANRFRDAATKRASKIGEEAFVPFSKGLAEVPATSDGLVELDKALEAIKGPVASLDEPVRARYVEAAAKRRDDITVAVRKEDERLAKLPLPGGVYVDPNVGAKLEFRNQTRVYITMFRDQTTEAEYEVDGEKIIIRQPQRNDVFRRDGAWLRGAGLDFKRQAAAN